MDAWLREIGRKELTVTVNVDAWLREIGRKELTGYCQCGCLAERDRQEGVDRLLTMWMPG